MIIRIIMIIIIMTMMMIIIINVCNFAWVEPPGRNCNDIVLCYIIMYKNCVSCKHTINNLHTH